MIEGVDGHMETREGQSTTLSPCIFFPILKIKEILFLSSVTPQAHIKGHIKQKKGVKFLVVLVVSLKKKNQRFCKIKYLILGHISHLVLSDDVKITAGS